MGLTAPATMPDRRPMLLSPDQRRISYTSKNGNTITLEMKDSKAANGLRNIAKQHSTEEKAAGTSDSKQGVWPGVYDTLSFWIAEAVEIAAFGPYTDPPK